MKTLTINSSTSTEAIEAAIPFLDMRAHALDFRDDPLELLAKKDVLEVHQVGNVFVLFSPINRYAYVNELATDFGSSMCIGEGEAESPQAAADQWCIGHVVEGDTKRGGFRRVYRDGRTEPV